LSYRNVEEILTECGMDFYYETARRRFVKFGPAIAANLRKLCTRPAAMILSP